MANPPAVQDVHGLDNIGYPLRALGQRGVAVPVHEVVEGAVGHVLERDARVLVVPVRGDDAREAEVVLGEARVDLYLDEEEGVVLLGSAVVPGLFDAAPGWEEDGGEGGSPFQDDGLVVHGG